MEHERSLALSLVRYRLRISIAKAWSISLPATRSFQHSAYVIFNGSTLGDGEQIEDMGCQSKCCLRHEVSAAAVDHRTKIRA